MMETKQSACECCARLRARLSQIAGNRHQRNEEEHSAQLKAEELKEKNILLMNRVAHLRGLRLRNRRVLQQVRVERDELKVALHLQNK